MLMTDTPSTLVDGLSVFRRTEAILGESIVWSASDRSALWTDITAGLLHRSPWDADDERLAESGVADTPQADTSVMLPPPLASFGPARLGARPERVGFVASLGDRIVLTDAAGSILRDVATIEHAHPAMRMNEGKADPAGRWVTGSMDLEGGSAGAFYAITGEGHVEAICDEVGVGNGLEWSPDGRRIYFTDTAQSTIYTGGYTPRGEIVDVSVFHEGAPHDGLVMDAEGHLWSAHYGEGRVVRYSPSGEPEFTLELPVPNVTSVAFGGPDLSVLLIATARENLTEQQLEEMPLSGSLFAYRTATHGYEARVFDATA